MFLYFEKVFGFSVEVMVFLKGEIEKQERVMVLQSIVIENRQ